MPKSRIPFDLIFVGSLSLLCALVATSGLDLPILRVIAGLPLVLILPGLAIRLAIFPKKIFGMAEQILIVIGTSIMLAACLGVILSALGMRLDTKSWSIFLSLITLITCLVAAYRRQRLGVESPLNFTVNLHWGQLLFLGFAGLILIGAFSFRWLPPDGLKTDQGYTIFWIRPDEAKPNLIHLGVNSNEFSSKVFRVSLLADGQALQEWQDITLAPGEKWETTYELTEQQLSTARVEAQLYKLDDPQSVYRQVWLAPKSIQESSNAP